VNKYSFMYHDREYLLGEDNFSYMINDEEDPVTGIQRSDILELLSRKGTVDFEAEYYDEPCQNCLAGKKEKSRYFKFFEYHFFIYTKKGEYVISNISEEYENGSFGRLLKKGAVDNSYIVSIAVCAECGDYSIEITQCDV